MAVKWPHSGVLSCAGAKYELPKYVLSEPSNLRRSKKCPQRQEQEMSRAALARAEADS